MQYIIQAPKHIECSIGLPSSKSISNRALVLCALAGSNKAIHRLSDCDDTMVLLRALKDMPQVIDIHAAGTAMRFMTAYLSVTEGKHTITGTERMRHRPIKPLVDALRQLGADIEYKGEEGFPPLSIRGKKLEGGLLEIPGNVSSQYISALLLIGPALQKGLVLKLSGDIVSRPYIDLTLHVMHEFGIEVDWTDVDTISVAHQTIEKREYEVESDWSAASYWYEILALLGDTQSQIALPGLYDSSRQGDSAVRYLFSMLGVKTVFQKDEKGNEHIPVITLHQRSLQRMSYDFVNQPDLAQTMTVACAALGIHFSFTGLHSLRIKETDRLEALRAELLKLGYVIEIIDDDELRWNGERCAALPHAVIDTYDDHRMAMSFAPMAAKLGSITINHPEVVSKSYPHFWDDLRKAGFSITSRS